MSAKSLRVLTEQERAERRYTYAQDHYAKVVIDKVGLTIEQQEEVLSTAVTAIDVIDSIIDFTRQLRADGAGTPMAGVANAFAEQIENRLRGRS